ncbi:oxygen-independent coproporphyrinogen III oxidase [Olivibacter sp. SA151]|uniref:oxygen-independent coproporphyrinogen III oxidase n=1 Tax=Olivibacter jilunii TaxID=985016 RepID=UPI003F163AD2
MEKQLINCAKKYNIAAPRYTSYPTVPYWVTTDWTVDQWVSAMRVAANVVGEISLYIHLPYCERLCTYCGCNTRITKSHSVERPYIDSVLQEWQLYLAQMSVKPKIVDLHLGGGTPTFFSPENLSYLIKEIIQYAHVDEHAAFSFEAHPANTTREHLDALFALGFRRLSLGIQDFDAEVQRIINRKQSPADVIRVTQEARRIGYTSINFDLIYGLPKQSLLRIKDTIQMTIAMHPDRIAFYSYAHVPWMKPGQRLYTEDDLPSDEAKLELYYVGKEMIVNAGYIDIGMDHFAFPTDSLALAARVGKLHRNFMGYTDIRPSLLLGLGVSAISDVGTAYAQNVKTVEEYRGMVEKGQFPLQKGHLQTEHDLSVKKQILRLMCEGRLPLSDVQGSPGVLKRLKPLIADGLVLLGAKELIVTDLGKSFLRVICMAFDEYHHAETANKPLFSKAV